MLVWGAFSAVAMVLQWAMAAIRMMSPMLEVTDPWFAVGILIAAGLWQLTPLKTVCLRHCRSPLGFLMGYFRAGHLGALRMGVEHGGFCLGCCWFLMALLFVGGIMNLYWIIGLTIYVIIEKSVPYGHWISWATGVGLVVWGVYLGLQNLWNWA